MSWAAHEFENYFLQKHVGLRSSFFAIALGTFAPDLFTKALVYDVRRPGAVPPRLAGRGLHALVHLRRGLRADRAVAHPQPGVGTRHPHRPVGPRAHRRRRHRGRDAVLPVLHRAGDGQHVEARRGRRALRRRGGVLQQPRGRVGPVLARSSWCSWPARRCGRTTSAARSIPSDPQAWSWLHRKLHLSERGLLLLYRGFFFYGLGRMTSWFLYARFGARTPFQPFWGGPATSRATTSPTRARSRSSSAPRSAACSSPRSCGCCGATSPSGCGTAARDQPGLRTAPA